MLTVPVSDAVRSYLFVLITTPTRPTWCFSTLKLRLINLFIFTRSVWATPGSPSHPGTPARPRLGGPDQSPTTDYSAGWHMARGLHATDSTQHVQCSHRPKLTCRWAVMRTDGCMDRTQMYRQTHAGTQRVCKGAHADITRRDHQQTTSKPPAKP